MDPGATRPEPRSVPGGPGSLKLDLGGTVVELELTDPALLEEMSGRYRGFTTGAAGADLVLSQEAGARGTLPAGGTTLRIPVERGVDSGYVDGLIRTRLPELVVPSLVAHGALLTDGERTYLCCGPSGSGKTTLAAMLRDRALCDELALLRPTADGFQGVSLPFWSARPGGGPLAGVFVLEHAPEHRRRRLLPGDAVRELRRHVYWPTGSTAAMATALGTLATLAGSTPVWRLGFRRDSDVWNVIREPAA